MPADKPLLAAPALSAQGSGRAGRGRGKGGRGGKSSGSGRAARPGEPGSQKARELAELDDRSIQHESSIEILRAERAAARRGKAAVLDSVRENEGVDEDDPLISVDDGIRIEPFNMRREMAEGHFDEGGFYILNKEEEKEVTDAWLDTIDKAQKTATFQRVHNQKKAEEVAASRISALSKNLGESENEEEEDTDEKQAKEDTKAAAREPVEEPEDEASIQNMLEELIAKLEPLETPSEALARWARGASARQQELRGAPNELAPLKMRSRIRQRRAEAAAAATDANTTGGAMSSQSGVSKAAKPGKRKLNEFGDYEERAPSSVVAISQKSTSAATSILATPSTEVEAAKSARTSANEGTTSLATAVDTAEAHSGETRKSSDDPGAANASALGTSSVIADPSEFAAAAHKAAEEEKAAEEADAAAIAEARVSRWTLYMDADATENPDVGVNLNAEAPRAELAAAAAPTAPAVAATTAAAVLVSPEAEGTPEPPSPQRQPRKRAVDPGDFELERRSKIEKLTDLCDQLLTKGVLVYDSTREQLAIEVRERRGENIGKEEETSASKDDCSNKKAQGMDGAAADAADDFFARRRAAAAASKATPAQATNEVEGGGMEGAAADAAEDFFSRRRAALAAAKAAALPCVVNTNADSQVSVGEAGMGGEAAEAAEDFFARRRKAALVEEASDQVGQAEARREAQAAKVTGPGDREAGHSQDAADKRLKGDSIKTQLEAPQVTTELPKFLFDNRRVVSSCLETASAAQSAAEALLRSSDTEAAPEPSVSQRILWQYRWGASPEQIYGPFDSVTMQGWMMQGCFAEDRAAEVRQCDESNIHRESCWHRWDEINYALYI